jgi:hypothetical protein
MVAAEDCDASTNVRASGKATLDETRKGGYWRKGSG